MRTEIDLKLNEPVALGGELIETLHLTEPRAADMEKAAAVDNWATSNIVLIAAVAKVPVSVVKQLCKRDFESAAKFLDSFHGAIPAADGEAAHGESA